MTAEPDSNPRRLPPVHAVLAEPVMAEWEARRGRVAVREAVRAAIDAARAALRADVTRAAPPGPPALAASAAARLAGERAHLRPVINATGILLHTGLGRAPLAAEAIDAVAAVARGYCNLEFDLEAGERGRRTTGVAGLLASLTGAETATVVNNNAAATVLALRATAAGREVIVSRGQLVEIGGSFRLPEIFAASGARLREVGTTNRTRLADYEAAIGPDTAALLRVHSSNYRIVGFTESVEIDALVGLARRHGVLAIDDVGSGALDAERPAGLAPSAPEPTIVAGLRAGADLVLASGDKLLGGPQCGLILGTREAVGRIAADPLMRAFRVDKLTLAALEATLHLALDPAHGHSRIPFWSFLNTPVAALQERAERLAGRLRRDSGLDACPVASLAQIGGGSVPGAEIASAAVRIGPPWPAGIGSEAALARALRLAEESIVPRVQDGAVWLDLRAVTPADDERLARALARLAIPGPPHA